MLAQTACYEGWQPPKGPGNGPSPGTPPSGIKPLAYVLFQPILMDAGAMSDASCFPKTGIKDFKDAEWSLRINAISAALAQVADQVFTNTVLIGASDCDAVTGIAAAALDSAPWGSNPPPTDDPQGRPLVHLKAAFWEGEPTAAPTAVETTTDWAAWSDLIQKGVNARSLHYFVISNPTNGHFSQWESKLPGDVELTGTPIDTVNPTQAGIEARAALISSDTATLTQWIQEHAL